jgi:F-type H+-transporting ATPase subunit delta
MSVANSYAKALYETAKETRQPVEQIEALLEQFNAAIESTRESKMALYGPVTTYKEKVAVVEAICQKLNITELAQRFLVLLARKERLNILADVRRALNEARLAAEGGVSGKVVSAEQMSASDVEDLAQAFGKKLGKKVAFQVSSDASLLAGMKVTVNGVTYDGTLRSQLQRLREQVAAGVNH